MPYQFTERHTALTDAYQIVHRLTRHLIANTNASVETIGKLERIGHAILDKPTGDPRMPYRDPATGRTVFPN